MSTHGCLTEGVKVRITRQRMVGLIARHSGADIAAGVTSGHSWHATPRSMGIGLRVSANVITQFDDVTFEIGVHEHRVSIAR